MERKGSEKKRMTIIIAGLCLIGMLASVGIALSLLQGASKKAVTVREDLIGNEEAQDANLSSTPEPVVIPTVVEEIKVDTGMGIHISDEEDQKQGLQEEPKKTASEKPAEPPAEIIKLEESRPDEKPENREIPVEKPTPTPAPSIDAQNGKVKDGKIYIEGFGWIDYDGGGTEGVYVEGMQENGNKVGSMD